MPKVAYLVVNEDLTTPLLRRQVIELLANEVAESDRGLEIKIVLFQSLPSLLRKSRRLKSLKKELRGLNIDLALMPNIVPWPLPNCRITKTDVGWRPNGVWNRFAARAFVIYAFPFLMYQYVVNKYKILHSRSYPPAFAAQAFCHMFRNCKHIFDPRSDFPEENVVAKRWQSNSNDFWFWKNVEKRLLLEADATACISSAYVDHYRDNAAVFSYFVAPNNVNIDKFAYDAGARNRIRRFLNWDEKDNVYVYLGGMSSSGWHRPEFYYQFLKAVKNVDQTAKLLLLIPRHANDIAEKYFRGSGDVVIKNPAYDAVTQWLSASDFGLMYMHKRRLAVGTKIGEYLSVGIPVLCNSNCLGTVAFLREYPEAGRVVDIGLGDLDESRGKTGIEEIVKLKNQRERLRKVAAKKFSNAVISKKYVSIYLSLGK